MCKQRPFDFTLLSLDISPLSSGILPTSVLTIKTVAQIVLFHSLWHEQAVWTERGEEHGRQATGKRSQLLRKLCLLWLGRTQQRIGEENMKKMHETWSKHRGKEKENLRQSKNKPVQVVV